MPRVREKVVLRFAQKFRFVEESLSKCGSSIMTLTAPALQKKIRSPQRRLRHVHLNQRWGKPVRPRNGRGGRDGGVLASGVKRRLPEEDQGMAGAELPGRPSYDVMPFSAGRNAAYTERNRTERSWRQRCGDAQKVALYNANTPRGREPEATSVVFGTNCGHAGQVLESWKTPGRACWEGTSVLSSFCGARPCGAESAGGVIIAQSISVLRLV